MTVAGRVAPEIDRLVVSVHLATREHHADEVRRAVATAGLESPAIVNDLAEFLVAGGVTDTLIARRFQYTPGTVAVDSVLGLVDSGHLTKHGDRWFPDDRLLRLADALLGLRARAAHRLWQAHGVTVEAAATMAAAVIAGATSPGPVFAAHRQLSTPADPWLALHHLLTTLRYLRFDGHTAAWTARGFGAATMRLYTALWSERGDVDEAPDQLVARGLAEPEPPRLTTAGRRARDEIEVATNRQIEPAFATLENQAGRFIAALAGLPG